MLLRRQTMSASLSRCSMSSSADLKGVHDTRMQSTWRGFGAGERSEDDGGM
jgi:hypothetical protein